METVGTVEPTDTGAEPVQTDTGEATSTGGSHTPDVDALLSQLERVQDQITPEKVRFLDRHFQPAFSRRVNLLNDTINEGVKTAFGDAGIQLPEGKSGLDMLTENGGKDFWGAVRGIVSKEFEPVKAKITQAEQQQVLQGAIARARKDDPSVDKHLNAAIEEIDSSPDLTKLAMLGNGNGLYYVLQGVAARREARDKDSKIQELTKILEANKIVVKTSGGTTKAGTGTPKQTSVPSKAKSIKEALAMAASRYKEDEG